MRNYSEYELTPRSDLGIDLGYRYANLTLKKRKNSCDEKSMVTRVYARHSYLLNQIFRHYIL